MAIRPASGDDRRPAATLVGARTGSVDAVSDDADPTADRVGSTTADGPPDAAPDVHAGHAGGGPWASSEPLDLEAIERDLSAVEAALPRLDDGSYWVDDDTGETIPDEVFAHDPLARRAP